MRARLKAEGASTNVITIMAKSGRLAHQAERPRTNKQPKHTNKTSARNAKQPNATKHKLPRATTPDSEKQTAASVEVRHL